ncbi:MAG TPA: hypothetical protein DEQ32_16560, partial [Gammaproteobacteria bacterium]|nr:hypothetical protein [Gammaproteobacteria bacterium]
MSAGDVDGFAAVAFPIVRRVFANLLAQDLVSVQPMSLPSGLIFFLDFKFADQYTSALRDGTQMGPTMPRLAAVANKSVYGGDVVGQQITGGVNLANQFGEKSFYALNNGYASPTGSVNLIAANRFAAVLNGTFGDANSSPGGAAYEYLRDDPTLVSGAAGTGTAYAIVRQSASALPNLNTNDLVAIVPGTGAGAVYPGGGAGVGVSADAFFARRLTRFSGSARDMVVFVALDPSPLAAAAPANLEAIVLECGGATGQVTYPIVDAFQQGDALGSLRGTTPWGLEANARIPEINIDVSSVAVTAITKKLKAKWSPELAQDLNAYHNLDAEVELTSILSEQIALEIDREILEDLVVDATAGTLWWSRSPGKFLNRETGAVINTTLHPDFTGTVSEWYETLLETINDVSARIHRKTLRGGANFLVCSPEVANIL